MCKCVDVWMCGCVWMGMKIVRRGMVVLMDVEMELSVFLLRGVRPLVPCNDALHWRHILSAFGPGVTKQKRDPFRFGQVLQNRRVQARCTQ